MSKEKKEILLFFECWEKRKSVKCKKKCKKQQITKSTCQKRKNSWQERERTKKKCVGDIF